jgi:hypothetical protein
MIAGSLGDRDESRRLLEAALKLNPAFDQLQAQKARTQLSQN